MILILGVTASGKSRLGFDLAKKIGAQIVSVDSMKVYRHMDVGTAKPSLERQKTVKHHLIDVVDPDESFSVGTFLDMAENAFQQIKADGNPVIAVGGTAMYIKTMLFGLFEGPPADEEIREKLKKQIETEGSWPLHDKLKKIDPEAGERIHPNDQRRIVRALEVYEITGKPISSFQQQFDAPKPLKDWTIIGLRRPKEIESGRINLRVKKMVEAGLVDEVKSLLENYTLSKQAANAIGYAEIIEHFKVCPEKHDSYQSKDCFCKQKQRPSNSSHSYSEASGNLELDKAIENIKVNTRRLAKGQRTWFKTFKDVNWIDCQEETDPEEILEKATQILSR